MSELAIKLSLAAKQEIPFLCSKRKAFHYFKVKEEK